MQLEWTGALQDSTKQRHVISMEFLQPYMSAGGALCVAYMTCLACMTDTACGWCQDRCIDRLSETVPACGSDADSFIINAEYCTVCADHIMCSSCLTVRLSRRRPNISHCHTLCCKQESARLQFLAKQSGNWVLTSLGNSGLYLTAFAQNRNTAVPAEGNGDLQTLFCVLVARPRRCLTSSNSVP